jgi:formate dehydrogenase subunit delta
MSPDKLAYMANQIGRFFAHQPHDKAVDAIELHLRRFWDPRMRAGIIAQPDGETVRLEPRVREAVDRLTEKLPT